MSEWDGVRRRVSRMRRSPTRRRVFGASGPSGHGFALAPPLTPSELAEAEAQFGVTLPADYRSFLLEVGAGGAGPCYGLSTLARSAGRWGWLEDAHGTETDPETLSTPFAPAPLDPAPMPPPSDEAAYNAWLTAWDGMLWAPGRDAGAICLSHEGCGYYQWLVVSGPHRGEIWSDARCVDTDLAPARTPSGAPLTFRDWYVTWLDAL